MLRHLHAEQLRGEPVINRLRQEERGIALVLALAISVALSLMVFSMTEGEWDAVIRVHLKGHFNTTRFAAAHWRERSKAAGAPVYGRIVNTSSEAFLAGSAGQPNYAAAKGGIVGLTTSTALALAKYGVTIKVPAAVLARVPPPKIGPSSRCGVISASTFPRCGCPLAERSISGAAPDPA